MPEIDRTARLWDPATGQEVRRFVVPDLPVVALADVLWTLCPQRSAIEIASGRLFAGRPPAWTLPRRPHRRSPGAKRPLRRGFNRVPELDRTARLWDPATGQEVRRFVGHTGTIGLAGAIAFTPNGKRVLTGSTDGAVRLWDVEIADTVADLCSRLQRDFTTEERAQYGIPDDGLTCAGQAGQ